MRRSYDMDTIDVSRREGALLDPRSQNIVCPQSSHAVLKLLTTAGVALLVPLKDIGQIQ